MTTSDWSWSPELDGVIAAPDSHRVLLETPAARVLEVVIEPGSREREHTHRNRSVMIVDAPARIRYYEHGGLTFESPPGPGPEPPRVIWMDPEGPHSVENIDATSYHAFRVEILD
jgi:quercetin dioxygenase-like cupin family protein